MTRGPTNRGVVGADPTVTAAAIAPARSTWAAAGGSAPAFGAFDVGGGATPIALGTTGKVQDSSWGVIGKEAKFSLRVIPGTGATGPTGLVTLTGLPVAPKMNTGHGRDIGWGQLIDASAGYVAFPVRLVIDPAFSTTIPVVFVDQSISGGNLVPVSLGDISGIWHDANPFNFTEGDILRISGFYETV